MQPIEQNFNNSFPTRMIIINGCIYTIVLADAIYHYHPIMSPFFFGFILIGMLITIIRSLEIKKNEYYIIDNFLYVKEYMFFRKIQFAVPIDHITNIQLKSAVPAYKGIKIFLDKSSYQLAICTRSKDLYNALCLILKNTNNNVK